VKLIVGLGNPGPRYASSRHNVGFRIVDHLARAQGVEVLEERFEGLYAEGFVPPPVVAGVDGVDGVDGGDAEHLGILKPTTFMNRSGDSVALALSAFPDVQPERDLLVVYDDLDLPLGRIRLRPRGGAGGHNGMGSIIEALGRQDFARLRFGIGRPQAPEGSSSEGRGEGRGQVIDFVLDGFDAQEDRVLAERIPTAGAAAETLLAEGAAAAMDRFNADPLAASECEAASS
jgi:PTH1 family peptidyl-tRNA hydrolase